MWNELREPFAELVLMIGARQRKKDSTAVP
jgi:hypothetical protein